MHEWTVQSMIVSPDATYLLCPVPQNERLHQVARQKRNAGGKMTVRKCRQHPHGDAFCSKEFKLLCEELLLKALSLDLHTACNNNVQLSAIVGVNRN